MKRVALRCAAALLMCLAVNAADPQAASALTGSQFRAGYLISDQVFYNSSSMSASSVQDFIAAKEASCTASTCMRNYRVTTPSLNGQVGLCGGYAGVTNEPASSVIAKVAVSCGVNPQSLLALIQKESGLVSPASTPSAAAYNSATGAGCPDSAPCNPAQQGFFNQVYGAAQQFKRYRLNPNNYNFVAGRLNQIAYNPNPSCGSSQVYIQNQATAGLYDYTPYQPNAAALANLSGAGDACSAYGNRNFWVIFNEWFGSTGTANFQLAPGSSPVGVTLPAGFQYALVGSGGTLLLSGVAGNGDLQLGVAPGTSPSIAAVAGGIQIAFQASGGDLWTVGALGNKDFGVTMAPGTSPSIAAVGNGYEIAYQGSDTALRLAGTVATARLPLGMAAGTSPSIVAVLHGYEVGFQANSTALWLVGAWGNLNTGLGMADRSSPSLAAVTGGVEVAFQSNAHALWLIGTLGNINTQRLMAAASSPSITAAPGGYEAAFAGADGTLWQTGSLGTANPRVGVRPSTSPAIAIFRGGARITFQGGDGILWTYGAGGTGQVGARA